MPIPDAFTFRKLLVTDIPFADELRAIAGWNQTQRDWSGYLDFEPDGCFVADVDGRRAGTATTIRYGADAGWIGMVLVHPDFRGRGLGTALIRQATTYLQGRGVRCVKLDATPMGRTVYLPMGFRDEYHLTRYQGTATHASGKYSTAVSAFTKEALPEVIAFDTSVFGSERARVIDSLSRRNPELCFIAREGSKLVGYLVAREGQEAIQLGPWIARDTNFADNLVEAFFERVSGRRIFLDIPHPNRAARSDGAARFYPPAGFYPHVFGRKFSAGRH